MSARNNGFNRDSGRHVGKRLATTAGLLLIPTALLVYLYVGMLNEDVDRSNKAIEGIHWARQMNEIRICVVDNEIGLESNHAELALKLAELGGHLAKAGIIDQKSAEKFKGIGRPDSESGRIDVRWRLKILKRVDDASFRARENLGYSMGVALRHDEISEILFSRLPKFAKQMFQANYELQETLLESDSQKAAELVPLRTGELSQLLAIGEDLDRLVRSVVVWIGEDQGLNLDRLKVGSMYEAFERDARRLLEKKRKLSFLDILGQSEGNGVTEREIATLWASGRSVSMELFKASKSLEAMMLERVSEHREATILKRNWVICLVAAVALLALLLGHYIVRNLSVFHEALQDQNRVLEEKIRDRVTEIEATRSEAIEAATVAQRERNKAVELNESLTKQTVRANDLARKAVAAEQTKSQFLANMSHEIRTPMNGVIGMTHLLRTSGLNAEQLSHVETLETCSDTLLALINEILDLSKIEAGKMEIEKAECDLIEIVSNSTRLFAAGAMQKGLAFFSDYPAGFDRRVVCDPYRLKQVFSNLLSNAVKFTDSGSVRFRMEIVEQQSSSATIRFSVSDTGMGIPKESQNRLFKAFTQADASTTRKFGGTGLGLVISRKLVRLMGGDLEVESDHGAGAAFSFTLKLELGDAISNRPIGPFESVGRVALAIESDLLGEHVGDALTGLGIEWERSSNDLQDFDPGKFGAIIIEDCLHSKIDPTPMGESSQPRVIVLANHGVNLQLEESDVVRAPFDPLMLLRALSNIETACKASSSKAANQTGTYSNLSVLLVDDNQVNLLVAEGLLEKFGIRVAKADSGEAALEQCRSKSFDMVFMDCMMPGMDGYEATREIRKLDTPNRDTVIVALTANAMKGDREKCLDSGMDDYLAKPLRSKDLNSILERWIDRAEPRAKPAKESLPEVDAMEPALLDLTEFNNIFGDKDAATIASLLALFTQTINEGLESLEEAIADSYNFDRMRLLSHSIRGSSANYGAARLKQVAAEMEEACVSEDREEAARLIVEIKRMAQLTVDAVEKQVS